MYLNPSSPAVAKRQAIEVRIVTSLIDELLAQGFSLSVFDGEEDSPVTTDKEVVIKAIMETDEDYLNVFKGKTEIGWFCLVYGNDGDDVISNYTTNMEEFIPKTLKIVNSY